MSALAAYHPGSPVVSTAAIRDVLGETANQSLAAWALYRRAVLFRRARRLLRAMDVALKAGDLPEAERLLRNVKASMMKAERIMVPRSFNELAAQAGAMRQGGC